jgi:pyruvate dehydrogenase E1 component alpha subunit
MESLNIAARWELPVVYVCENNTFSELTPSSTVTAGKLIDRAKAFGMPTYDVDGNDVSEVWQAAGESIERARKDGGPSFIEAHTYRWRGHIEAEERFTAGQKYREDAEIESWIKKCPVERLKKKLLEDSANAGDVSAIEKRIADTVEAAAEFAASSPPADIDLAFKVMFSDHRP